MCKSERVSDRVCYYDMDAFVIRESQYHRLTECIDRMY